MNIILAMRLTGEEKREIINLAKKGKTLNQIIFLLGLKKTTIYYHFKKVNPVKKRIFTSDKVLPYEIGELIGAFAGDGSYVYSREPSGGRHHRIRYTLSLIKDLDYSKYLATLLKKLNLNSCFIYNRKENTVNVSTSSKDFIQFIKKFIIWEDKKTYSVRLLGKLSEYDLNFLRGFARGLMDTDGFVENCGVGCGSTSKELISNLEDIFNKFGIESKRSVKMRTPLRKNLHLIRIGKKNLRSFYEEIGFSNPYKLNSVKEILNINGDTRI